MRDPGRFQILAEAPGATPGRRLARGGAETVVVLPCLWRGFPPQRTLVESAC